MKKEYIKPIIESEEILIRDLAMCGASAIGLSEEDVFEEAD